MGCCCFCIPLKFLIMGFFVIAFKVACLFGFASELFNNVVGLSKELKVVFVAFAGCSAFDSALQPTHANLKLQKYRSSIKLFVCHVVGVFGCLGEVGSE